MGRAMGLALVSGLVMAACAWLGFSLTQIIVETYPPTNPDAFVVWQIAWVLQGVIAPPIVAISTLVLVCLGPLRSILSVCAAPIGGFMLAAPGFAYPQMLWPQMVTGLLGPMAVAGLILVFASRGQNSRLAPPTNQCFI